MFGPAFLPSLIGGLGSIFSMFMNKQEAPPAPPPLPVPEPTAYIPDIEGGSLERAKDKFRGKTREDTRKTSFMSILENAKTTKSLLGS